MGKRTKCYEINKNYINILKESFVKKLKNRDEGEKENIEVLNYTLQDQDILYNVIRVLFIRRKHNNISIISIQSPSQSLSFNFFLKDKGILFLLAQVLQG